MTTSSSKYDSFLKSINNELKIPGWITDKEIIAVYNLMVKKICTKIHERKILDIGAFAGKLFYCLYDRFNNWKYVAVDPWEYERVRYVHDWNADYWAPGNLQDRIIKEKDFIKNCPFAERHKKYFEEFDINEKFDIIVLSLIGPHVDWNVVLSKACIFLKDDGFLVVRNMNIEKTERGDDHNFNHAEYMMNMLESLSIKFVSSEAEGRIQVWKT